MTKKIYKSWVNEIEEQLLPKIEKPVQYLGNEFNSSEKNPEEAAATLSG